MKLGAGELLSERAERSSLNPLNHRLKTISNLIIDSVREGLLNMTMLWLLNDALIHGWKPGMVILCSLDDDAHSTSYVCPSKHLHIIH